MKIFIIHNETKEKFELADLVWVDKSGTERSFKDTSVYSMEYKPEPGDVVDERLFLNTYLEDCDVIQEILKDEFSIMVKVSLIDTIWREYSDNVDASWLCLYKDENERKAEVIEVFRKVLFPDGSPNEKLDEGRVY